MPGVGGARRVQAIGMAMAASGLALVWGTGGIDARPTGLVILVAGLIGCMALRGLMGSGLGLLATALVVQRVILDNQIADVAGRGGVGLAAGRAVEVTGLVLASVAAIWHLREEFRLRVSGAPPLQIAGLLILSAVGAELLAAYDDSTGRVGPTLFAIVYFAALYGAPALLIREVARRRGWGWPSMLLLALAPAILQPGVIDQALFSEQYREFDGWGDSRARTFIPPLGLSAHMALTFILGHVIYSFSAPIAIAEAWRPAHAYRPWLGGPGLAVAAVGYVGAALLIVSQPESQGASPVQLAWSMSAAVLCVCAAAWLGRRRETRPGAPWHAPAPWAIVVATVLLAGVGIMGGETWVGVALTLGTIGAMAVALVYVSRARDWSIHHTASVGLGFLLCRALLAFTYYPLVGEVSATRKYSHNMVMLAVVAAAGWFALRGLRRPPESE